jgi:hypothetical protein
MKTVSVSEIIRTAQLGDTEYVLASEANEQDDWNVKKLKELELEQIKSNERIKVLEETIAARDRECKSEHYNTLESQDTEIALLRKRIKVMEGEKANEGD